MNGEVTYYDEIDYATLKDCIIVKVGWDFQHSGDEYYSTRDNGEDLIIAHAEEMIDQFIKIHQKLEEKQNDNE